MVNITQGEWEELQELFRRTPYSKMAEFLRSIVIERKITVLTRSENLEEAVPHLQRTNEEIRRIGANLNMLVRHLQTYKAAPLRREVQQLFVLIHAAARQQEEIRRTLHEIHESWLQS